MMYPICPVCRSNGGRWRSLRRDTDVLIIDERMREVQRIERLCANEECGFVFVQYIPFEGEEGDLARLGEKLMKGD